MEMARKTSALAALRQKIRQIERLGSQPKARAQAIALLPALDSLWPEKGLPLGCLHEVQGDNGPASFAAMSGFAAAIAGRLGTTLWVSTRADFYGAGFYAPGLAQVGLSPTRLIAATVTSESDLLAVMEEGLRHRALACVIGEVGRLNLIASRRLQLAGEKSGVTAFVLRTARTKAARAQALTEPITAASRWRITAMPSSPHAVPEAGRACWRLELLQSRSGATGDWIVEAPDAQGHLRLSSPVADGVATTPVRARLAAG
jgi:protein ImuA